MLCLVCVGIDYLLLHLTAIKVKRSDIDRYFDYMVIFRLGLDVCATKDHLN